MLSKCLFWLSFPNWPLFVKMKGIKVRIKYQKYTVAFLTTFQYFKLTCVLWKWKFKLKLIKSTLFSKVKYLNSFFPCLFNCFYWFIISQLADCHEVKSLTSWPLRLLFMLGSCTCILNMFKMKGGWGHSIITSISLKPMNGIDWNFVFLLSTELKVLCHIVLVFFSQGNKTFMSLKMIIRFG